MSRWLISFKSFTSKRRGQRQPYACTHISTAHSDLIQFDGLLHSVSAKSIELCLKVWSCVSTWLSCRFKGESVVRLVTTSFYFDNIKTTQHELFTKPKRQRTVILTSAINTDFIGSRSSEEMDSNAFSQSFLSSWSSNKDGYVTIMFCLL